MAGIAVLLAVYNGEKYLPGLLDSLFAQTCGDFDLIVSDDGSADRTLQILAEYTAKYPGRMILMPAHAPSGSSRDNFLYLTASTEGYDYYMYCDQDDVWLPDKVRQTLAEMKRVENGEKDVPCLVHTDLEVTDAQMHTLHPSFFYSSYLDPGRDSLNRLLVQNIVTGCTMMFNRTLRDLCCLPSDRSRIVIHDWWIALVCAACGGRIGFLARPTIRYRQHGDNVVGAKDVRSLRYALGYAARMQKNRSSLRASQAQALNLMETLGDRIPESGRRMLRDYGHIREKGKPGRIAVLFRHGIWLKGLKRKVGELLLI